MAPDGSFSWDEYALLFQPTSSLQYLPEKNKNPAHTFISRLNGGSVCIEIFRGSRTVIDEAGCDLVAVYVNKCSGYCMSFSFPNPHQGNKLTVYAKCCRITDVELIDVEINCSEGERKVKVPSARECSCFDCA